MSAPPPPPSRPREGDDELLLVAGATPEGALLTLQVRFFACKDGWAGKNVKRRAGGVPGRPL